MRITGNMIADTVLRNIMAAYGRFDKYEEQLSTGKLFRRPSDAPIIASQAFSLRATIKEMDQHMKNIQDGVSWLNTADVALMEAVDILHRAKELATMGANSTIGTTERNGIAIEVDQLIESMVSVGNTKYAGRYIFAGNLTTTKPFNIVSGPPTSVNYSGDTGNFSYEIEKGVIVPINLSGSTVFDSSADVFQVLIDLRDHVKAGDYSAASQDTSRVDDALNTIIDAQIIVGARTNRLEATRDRIEQDKINFSEILSDLEDIDFPEVVTKLKMEETVYQAALMSGSSLMQKSLIDFLR